MKIAIDAKRAFHNSSGLGSYSRNLIDGLSEIDQENEYFLFTPQVNKPIYTSVLGNNFKTLQNKSLIKPYWRSFSITKDLIKHEIDLYHGVSNELPLSISPLDLKTVVTIHDLLYLRFPQLYPILDRNIYFHKAKKSCAFANKIIATSHATKKDIIEKLGVEEEKIEVVYQSCADNFFKTNSEKEKIAVQKKYNLPSEFILFVGRIEERKNIQKIIEAIGTMDANKRLPLVIVGRGTSLVNSLEKLAKTRNVQIQIEQEVSNEDLPMIYQSCELFIYPAFYEGFGIPVLEAIVSKKPVITSKDTSMAELIADENCLVNPYDVSEIASKIEAILKGSTESMVADNLQKVKHLTNLNFAKAVQKIYHTI